MSKAKGPLLIAVTAILWSFGGLLIQELASWHPMAIVGMRAIFAASILAIYMRRPRITFSPSIILGAICMAGTTILFVYANALTTAANAIVLQYTAPIFVIILSMVFLKKRPRALDFAAVLVTFAGIALFFVDALGGGGKSDFTNLLGIILACLSGLTFAGVFLINTMPKAVPEQSLLLGYLISIAIGLPFILTGGVTFEPAAWVTVTLLGIFQLGVAYVLFSIGIKLTAPITASLIAVLEPLLNPLWVFLLHGKGPGLYAIIGGVVVLIAVVAYNVLTIRQNRGVEVLNG